MIFGTQGSICKDLVSLDKFQLQGLIFIILHLLRCPCLSHKEMRVWHRPNLSLSVQEKPIKYGSAVVGTFGGASALCALILWSNWYTHLRSPTVYGRKAI